MHRSGTSLTASWLEACGLALSDGRVIGSDPGNPRGHFEDRDFVMLHAAAITRQHPESRGWIVAGGATHFQRREKLRVLRLAWRRHRKYGKWGWKDPRTCLFLEDYARLLPTMKVLIVQRPREEVVDSLVRRARDLESGHVSKVDRQEAEAVFDHYHRSVEAFASRHPRRCLEMQLAAIIDDDRAAFESINRLVGGGLRFVPMHDVYYPDDLIRRSSSSSGDGDRDGASGDG